MKKTPDQRRSALRRKSETQYYPGVTPEISEAQMIMEAILELCRTVEESTDHIVDELKIIKRG